jgi:dipeptidyl aminopeptidase/acylaminoacyl peptidase
MRVLLVLLATLVAAPPANAAIVYSRGNVSRSVYIANDDGSGSRRLTSGESPHLSPDGQAVIYVSGATEALPELREIPAAGGDSKLLVKPYQFGSFAWSADGRYVAVESYRLNRTPNLVLVDRAAGTTRTVATGTFYGATFSPDSTQLLYARTGQKNALYPKSNLEIVPTAGGTPRVLFTDGRAQYPLWGPTRIVYDRWQKPARKQDGPKLNLWLVNADGSGRHQLTHDKVPFLQAGLTPTAWSADGTRLLTEFGGQDTAYAVTVDPVTGKEKVVGKKFEGFIATALSKDGTTILGSSGGFEWPGPAHIVTAPYTGGKTTTLISRGDSPEWNR